jgi:hypothetical protein
MYNYILLREFLKNKKTEEEAVILSPDENVEVDLKLENLQEPEIKLENLQEPEIKLEQDSTENNISEIISLSVEIIKSENEQAKKSNIRKIKILNESETIVE